MTIIGNTFRTGEPGLAELLTQVHLSTATQPDGVGSGFAQVG